MTGIDKGKAEPHLVSDNAVKNPERTIKLFDKIGGEAGLLGPMVRMLKKLTEDPILKDALDSAPVDNSKKH